MDTDHTDNKSFWLTCESDWSVQSGIFYFDFGLYGSKKNKDKKIFQEKGVCWTLDWFYIENKRLQEWKR